MFIATLQLIPRFYLLYYTKIHGYPPAEADIQRYFKVSLPSVHQMVLTLKKKGLIEKDPHKSRSIQFLLPREELPDME
ncbi:MAG: MarR family transcriptional regulator [Desulfobacterium sp. 4572_20]|nr:MarR family transcriptional regulator [Deltaproteobacteria bacterium]OQY17251.1 MAG: MarR family transcriptional regulator [Desulfobacterium sp. 4572_20]HDH86679.1 MarR family transcriptional regulator [Desulfobacteraceae bacterium]